MREPLSSGSSGTALRRSTAEDKRRFPIELLMGFTSRAMESKPVVNSIYSVFARGENKRKTSEGKG